MVNSVNNNGINNVLAQIRQLQASQTSVPAERMGQPGEIQSAELNSARPVAHSSAPGFAEALTSTLNAVNGLQQNAGDMAQRFESGDPDVKLSSVMIEMQKSRIAFEATAQVRNRVVAAYQDIMNMQI